MIVYYVRLKMTTGEAKVRPALMLFEGGVDEAYECDVCDYGVTSVAPIA